MTTEKIFDEALKNILSEDEILKDEPMKHHTTFRVGGPARVLSPSEKRTGGGGTPPLSHISKGIPDHWERQ